MRVARELRGKTQQECSELTGIERSTLANYEAEVTPLGYDQAKRICYRLNINQWWFATGASPFAPYFDLSPNLEFSIKQNTLFSQAFDAVLKVPLLDQIETLVRQIGAKAYFSGKYDDVVLDNMSLVSDDPGEAAAFYVQKALKMKFNWMPEQFRLQFAEALLKAEEEFRDRLGLHINKLVKDRQMRDAAVPPPSESEKKGLLDISTLGNNEGVKPKLPELLKRLNEATRERGTKSALAKFMGVPLPKISQWLSGTHEPGGETTLRLLQWVEQQERQK